MAAGEHRMCACSVVVIAGAIAVSACTVSMYPGPARPAAETAVVAQGTGTIESLDGMALPVGTRFAVGAGSHWLAAKAEPGAPEVAVCFRVLAGHRYRVFAYGRPGLEPLVVDDATGLALRTFRRRAGVDCWDLMAKGEVAGAGGAAARGSPPDASAQGSDDDERGDAPRRAVPLGPPPRLVQAEPSPRKPAWGMTVELGIGGGGSDLASVTLSDGSRQTLSAGSGASISAGLMWTPLWVSDNLGIGVSGTVGDKMWSVGERTATSACAGCR
jgi:hypothetical protein